MNVRIVLVPAVVALCAAGILFATRDDNVPAATWRTGTGADVKQGRNYDELAPETPVQLSFTCGRSRYVWVFSHSDTDGTLLLFPSPDVKSNRVQPLPPGQSTLPGKRDDKELAWTTRADVVPTTTFLVVAAAEPIPELQALMPKLRRWTNSALTSQAMSVTNPATGTELAGGPRQPLPEPLLQRAADLSLTATLINGPLTPDSQRANTWLGSWRVKEKPAPPDTEKDGADKDKDARPNGDKPPDKK
jgi:hypothetical protein